MMLVTTLTLKNTDLNTLPAAKAVYAIYGLEKGHGRFTGCRYAGSTDNLRESIISHFSECETNKYLREFMQSDLTPPLPHESSRVVRR